MADVTFAGGTLALQIFGTTAGIDFDRLTVSNINLNSQTPITIDLGAFDPLDDGSQSFIVIDNIGSNSVNLSGGLFAYNGTPLAQGDTFFAGTQQFQINYAGGTGNDVAVVAIPEPTLGGLTTAALGLLLLRRRRS